ncbi:MAG: hypothetical protein KDD67_17475 [Ignavibacteriae bacterium]|nr:hypothetical protein [Ignavibacteriota bacterium]
MILNHYQSQRDAPLVAPCGSRGQANLRNRQHHRCDPQELRENTARYRGTPMELRDDRKSSFPVLPHRATDGRL